MKTLLCIACILVCSVAGLAQERSIDKTEFDALTKTANHPLARWPGKKSFRRITSIESLVVRAAKPDAAALTMKLASSSISDYAVDSKTMYHFTSETSSGDEAPQKRETIRVGDYIYKRAADGPWTKTAAEPAPKPPPPPTPSSSPAKPSLYEDLSTEVTYKYMGIETYKNAPVQVYIKTQKVQRMNKETGNQFESVATTKILVAADGTFLKSDYHSSQKDGESSTSLHSIEEFELDPSISITAPIVS